MKSVIDVKNLSFRYKESQEYYDVKDITFHVKRGEWLSIVGHNGSGKSTTVRLIDGLLEAESGEIVIDGQRLTEENVWNIRRQIGMVFQNPDNQFVGATVEDDVAFGLENQGLSRPEMKKRVNNVIRQAGNNAKTSRSHVGIGKSHISSPFLFPYHTANRIKNQEKVIFSS